MCLIFKQWFLVLQNAVFSSDCTWQLCFLVPWNYSSTFFFLFFSVLSKWPRQQSCHSILKVWGTEAWSCLASGILQVTGVLSTPSHLLFFRSWQPLRKWFGGKSWHFGNKQLKSKRKKLKIIPSTTFFGRVEPDAKRGVCVWYLPHAT